MAIAIIRKLASGYRLNVVADDAENILQLLQG